MSVAFGRAYAAGMRARGIRVIEQDGCWTRGNGQTSNFQGGLIHHTGAVLDGGLGILINGRPDLGGPLCNTCGHANGDVRLIATHPANHAGASGGKSMGPLPVSRVFNRLVWGHEVMYPGSSPMTREQMHTAIQHAAVVAQLVGGDPERVRAHAETSITGKWDPGYAPGKTIDMRTYRASVRAALIIVEDDMFTDEDRRMVQAIYGESTKRLPNRVDGKTNDTVLGYAANADAYGLRTVTMLVGMRAAIDALAAEKGIDPAELQAAVERGAATAIQQHVLPALRGVVHEVLGEDNANVAEDVVDELTKRLHAA